MGLAALTRDLALGFCLRDSRASTAVVGSASMTSGIGVLVSAAKLAIDMLWGKASVDLLANSSQ